MRLPTRRPADPIEVAAGERLLAWAETDDGHVGGTRDALYLQVSTGSTTETLTRIPWEEVEAADWDLDSTTLTVTEVGRWGEVRPAHRVVVAEPGRLLQLVRERVTASVLLQRHVRVTGRAGVRVIARRAPSGARPLTWVFEYDAGIDPDDPLVRIAAGEALAAAREEVGDT